MTSREKIAAADLATLALLKYPDPRLREACVPVDTFDAALGDLYDAMLGVMVKAKGVGLAAQQVGVGVCMCIVSPTGQAADTKAYINPKIIAADGVQEEEEGCLSFPGIYTRIRRSATVTVEAQDLQGNRFRDTGTGLAARAFEHEMDHLAGRLLIDRMGTVARLAHRKSLKQLEEAASR